MNYKDNWYKSEISENRLLVVITGSVSVTPLVLLDPLQAGFEPSSPAWERGAPVDCSL